MTAPQHRRLEVEGGGPRGDGWGHLSDGFLAWRRHTFSPKPPDGAGGEREKKMEKKKNGAIVSTLYLALELGGTSWKLAFTTGLGQKPRLRKVDAGDREALVSEVKLALERFGLAAETRVVSCYEAGRDGFWVHRFLLQAGIANIVVDSASIEVPRRKKRRKTDSLDARKLVAMLVRHHMGEKVWSVVEVPSEEAEDARHLHRERKTLKEDENRCVNRIRSLLATQGLSLASVANGFPEWLEKTRRWDGSAVPVGVGQRLMMEFERLQMIRRQVLAIDRERRRRLREGSTQDAEKACKLKRVRGIGDNGAWVISVELLTPKTFRNRKQVGSMAGLTPTPFISDGTSREQGIDKAGNRWVRSMMIELAWGWLRFQPDSKLTAWYKERYAGGSKRLRKIGIVALARRILIALWRWVEYDQVPEGAIVEG